MEAITLKELLLATGGELLGLYQDRDTPICSVETDSRSVRSGSLFVPLIGERTDGHKFIEGALRGGAVGCITDRELPLYLANHFYVKVKNTQDALGDLARYYRQKFPIPYIAITGSVGKTTTKDMVAAVLGEKFRVLKTDGNYNNEIGLPLTLFRLEERVEICVLEMGMSSLGEIEYLCGITEPAVSLITNIGAAHMENLGSYENILKAKAEVFSHMQPGGLAVLNGDDKYLATLEGKLKLDAIFYGVEGERPYQVTQMEPMKGGIRCQVKTPQETFTAEVPALGAHMAYAVLAATVVGEHFGMKGAEIAAGIAKFVPTKMRMNVIKKGDITILNDTYNANPQSMRAALEVLSTTESSYKVAILGDMLELGVLGPSLHQGIGQCAGKRGIDCLVAVGELARNIYEAAKASSIPDVFYFPTKEEAKTILADLTKPGATILVKASRGMEFEDLVKELERVCPRA